MKKLILSALAIFALTTANAQKTKKTNSETTESFNFKPVKGTLTTEVGVSGGLLNTNFATINSTAKFRYFIKDDLAVRAGLGLGSRKEEINTVLLQNTPNQYTVNEKETVSSKTFSVGIEKHFSGTERLSTYVGADILLGFTGATYDKSQTNNGNTTSIVGGTNGINLNGNGSSSFGLRATVGADYYFTKKLYLGVEVGLGYSFGTKDEVKTTTVTGTTTTTTVIGEGKTSTTSTNTIGGLKLGFQF